MLRPHPAIIVIAVWTFGIASVGVAAAKDKGSPDITVVPSTPQPMPTPYPNVPIVDGPPPHGPRSEPQYPLGPHPQTATGKNKGEYIGETEKNLRR